MTLRRSAMRHYSFIGLAVLVIIGIQLVVEFHLRSNQPSPYVRIVLVSCTAAYLGLFIYWGIWLGRRLVHPQIRKALLGVNRLMILWIILRSMKFYLITAPEIQRFLWYGYYFPMLFIPILTLVSALTLGKNENFRVSRRWGAMFYSSFVLFLLVITNDFHQIVFRFRTVPFSEHNYGYGIGYYAIVVWLFFLMICTFVVIIRRSRRPKKRRMVLYPIFPILIMVVYLLLSYLRIEWIHFLGWDVTIVMCTCIAAAIESCIHLGLIQSNQYYQELAIASNTGILIVDDSYRVFLESLESPAGFIPGMEELKTAEQGPIILDNDIRLSSRKLAGGRVFWQEDVSEIQGIIRELDDTYEYLRDREMVQRRSNMAKADAIRLSEQNRLYQLLMEQMEPVFQEYQMLIQFAGQAEEIEAEEMIARMGVVVSYIKRRCNLFLVNQAEGQISAQELYYSLKESLESLSILGIRSGCNFHLTRSISYEQMAFLYDCFQETITQCLPGLQSIFISIIEEDEKTVMKLRIIYEGVFPIRRREYVEIEQDEEEWLVSFHV